MKRGEIRFVDFDPIKGSEANKRRPALIVSNDYANEAVERYRRGVVTVVPLTSDVSRVLPFQVFLPTSATGLPRDSKAQAEQLRAVAWERLGPVLTALPREFMTQVDTAIRLHLAL